MRRIDVAREAMLRPSAKGACRRSVAYRRPAGSGGGSGHPQPSGAPAAKLHRWERTGLYRWEHGISVGDWQAERCRVRGEDGWGGSHLGNASGAHWIQRQDKKRADVSPTPSASFLRPSMLV